MAEFKYQEPFPVEGDTTEYRLLTKNYVKTIECDGRKILKVEKEGLENVYTIVYKKKEVSVPEKPEIPADPEIPDTGDRAPVAVRLAMAAAAAGTGWIVLLCVRRKLNL